MGCTPDKTGITIQLVKNDGTPDGAPIFGPYAQFFGKQRPEMTPAAGATPDEIAFQGSNDWLTLIAVADTQEKLEKILTGSTLTTADTSGSSRRVQIVTDVGGVQNIYTDRITIASGPLLQLKPVPKVDVVHVKVLPAGTIIGDSDTGSGLVAEFSGNSITLAATSK